jgi:hypothetical protein
MLDLQYWTCMFSVHHVYPHIDLLFFGSTRFVADFRGLTLQLDNIAQSNLSERAAAVNAFEVADLAHSVI